MASFRETSGSPSEVAMEEEDIRGDGKKKKFKPLSAVRKLFGKKRKKEDVSVVSVKAQSTTALHSASYAVEEDDDDGGFKSHHQKSATLGAGNRSISEDSVFSPESREGNISGFPKSAVSEESLPKSSFQSELFSKLSKRRSQYSDDDHDDGLPKSPVPPVTTADVIMERPIKAGGSGKKSSNNRDSDQSLISVDSSETEEDELFTTKWKSSVPSKKLSSGKSTNITKGKMDLDFNNIEKTEVLKSNAAKDRISVKPQGRRSSRQSRKKRDTSSPQSLPSLNEESPTRSMSEEARTGSESGSPLEEDSQAISDNNKTVTVQASSSAAPVESSASRPKLSSITITSEPKPASPPPNDASTQNAKVISPAPSNTKVFGQSQKFISSPSSPTTKAITVSSTSSSSHTINTKISSNVSPATCNEKSHEATGGGKDKESSIKSRASIFNQKDSDAIGSIDIKSRMSQFQGGKKASNAESPSLKVSDPESNITLSPKDDYKQKRQSRSRTLPGASDDQNSEQNSPKVQRASSHRAQTSPTKSTDTTSEEKSAPVVKKLDTSRFGNINSASSSSTPNQPSWLSKVNKRSEEQEVIQKVEEKQNPVENLNKEETVASEQASSKFGGSGAQKSVFSSSSYSGRKRGSIEPVSVKEKDSSEQTVKNEGRRPSTDRASSKRESIEIDVSEMSFVKALSSSYRQNTPKAVVGGRDQNRFNNASDTSSSPPKASTTSTADRAQLFSGGGENQSPSTGRPPIGGSGVGSRVGQFRGGSVKTSPTKSLDVKSTLPARGGSVKTPSVFTESSGSSKFSTSNTQVKSDNKTVSSSPFSSTPSSSSSTSSSVHASKHSTSSTNPTMKSEPQVDKSSHRSSKVLDMVKNFQNLQVSS